MPQAVPPWLTVALAEIGTVEMPGAANNSRILDYHRVTTLKAGSDSVPWCSAWACWVMEQAGIRSTRSAAARSWQSWGEPVSPRLGCVVVLSRGSNPAQGHVGFLLDRRDNVLFLLGGNQSDRVCIAQYGTSGVLGYRWPTETLRQTEEPPN